MTEEFAIATLSAPRYVPCAIVGACLATWYDRQEDRYITLPCGSSTGGVPPYSGPAEGCA